MSEPTTSRPPLSGLTERRKAAGISQKDAGQWNGVTKQNQAHWETGRTPLDIHRARVIASHLGCSLEHLF
jgi:DNA-binding XRE family transcriptional regulator